MKQALVLATCVACVAAGNPWESDLKRARQWTPRAEYRGSGSLASANARLNMHLAAKKGIQLKTIYSKVDGRGAKYSTVLEMETHWKESAPADDLRVRDAHCHEAVMWFVHHLTSEDQARAMETVVLPMLPVADHKVAKGTRDVNDA